MEIMDNAPDMVEEYDFGDAICGKYASKCSKGTNLIRLEPELTEYFPDSASVNEALKSFSDTAVLL